MLPLELLKVIFGALSRDDLDALMLTNALFRDIVTRDFAKEPLRYFAELGIAGYKGYEFGFTTGRQYSCQDDDDFGLRMRLARVGRLRLDIDLDEDLFNILLPHKDAWRNGYVQPPYSFASQSLFERAFSELLFCRSMRVITDGDDQLRQPFTSLPAIRECTSLDLFRLTRPLTVAEVIEWLNVVARSQEPKRLEMVADDLADGVRNLLQQLKTDFVEATTARRYVVRVFVHAHEGQSGRTVNKDTSEELIIGHGTDESGIRCLEVERKSTDEKQ